MMFPKSLVASLSFVTLLVSVLATPLPAPTRPAVPSVHDFQTQHLNVQPDKSLFYSGVSGKAHLQYQKDTGLHRLNEAWKDKTFQDQFQNHVGDSHKFFNQASEALAKSASGKVHVMLPEGAPNSGKATSTWAQHEWPHLQRPGVEVHRVNVDTAGKATSTQKIWGRRRELSSWMEDEE